MTGEEAPTILELRSDVLSNPWRLDLAEIEALMIFPGSEEKRNKYFASALVELFAEYPETVPEYKWRELFFIARNARPITDWQDEALDIFVKGSIVGGFLHDKIGYEMLGIHKTSAEVAERVIKLYKKNSDGGYVRTSVSDFNSNVWPKFKCVAHFWAASVLVNINLSKQDMRFPCRLVD
jgi:hypothetical protein